MYEAFRAGATTVQPRILEHLDTDVEMQKEFVAVPARLRGVLDDGRNGAETSALIETVKKAPAELFIRARAWYVAIRSGKVESMLRAVIPVAMPADVELLKMLADGAQVNRLLSRGKPRLALHMFATFVHSDVPAELLSAPATPDVRTLRSGELDLSARTRASGLGDSA